mmetsp:Transcript_6913/g.24585  ORF Transcript_6913/g.24585 Transcript_6913/m.24585 type:complete len:286 (-) Transcript_6913:272-1129(-)
MGGGGATRVYTCKRTSASACRGSLPKTSSSALPSRGAAPSVARSARATPHSAISSRAVDGVSISARTRGSDATTSQPGAVVSVSGDATSVRHTARGPPTRSASSSSAATAWPPMAMSTARYSRGVLPPCSHAKSGSGLSRCVASQSYASSAATAARRCASDSGSAKMSVHAECSALTWHLFVSVFTHAFVSAASAPQLAPSSSTPPTPSTLMVRNRTAMQPSHPVSPAPPLRCAHATCSGVRPHVSSTAASTRFRCHSARPALEIERWRRRASPLRDRNSMYFEG